MKIVLVVLEATPVLVAESGGSRFEAGYERDDVKNIYWITLAKYT